MTIQHLKNTQPGAFLCTLILIVQLSIQSASASQVEEVDLPEISQNSELIFEGQVIAKSVRRHPDDGRPMTYFTFQIDEVVKGSYLKSKIELGFEGGTIDGLTAEISDLEMPVMGERGIYFVESISEQLVHPLYGWNQGHYLIETDAVGTRRVKRVKSEAIFRKTQSSSGSRKLDNIFISPPSVSDFKQQILDNLNN